ncbi:hypothetical protein PYH66_13440 (plasmid) [Staphylococcus delphini]|uniref:hypothetical protein n=1 Tax=Staphylococcus delphini TaxID=53344 RepID=UPI003364E931
MSSFVHSETEFNTLGKYFKEVIKLDSDFTDHLIFNLYQFELISVNTRYDKNNSADIMMYKGEGYNNLEVISSYDALKLLNSIKYQASDMNSDMLWNQVLNVHQKLVEGIVKIENIPTNYKETELYAESQWW